MCIMTSGKGLYHNMKDWNFSFCSDYKIMEQDAKKAMEAFQSFGCMSLFNRLKNWDFSLGAFKISKEEYPEALSAIKQLADQEETNRLAMAM